MKYQVQISRLLNPTDREDRDYLVDLPAGERLAPEDEWFAVFMRVENDDDKRSGPRRATTSIRDTQGNASGRSSSGPRTSSPTAAAVPPQNILPMPGSAAEQNVDPGRDAALQDPDREPREPPAGARRSARPPRRPAATVDLDV